MYYIYKYVENNKIIYIGKTVNLKQRIYQHSIEKKFMEHPNASIYFFECASEADMTIYEIYYIYKYKPELNVSYNQRPDSFIKEIFLEEKEWKEYSYVQTEEYKDFSAKKQKKHKEAVKQCGEEKEKSLETPLPFSYDENYWLRLQIKSSLNPLPDLSHDADIHCLKYRIYNKDYFEHFQMPALKFLYYYLECHETDIANNLTEETIQTYQEEYYYYIFNYYLTKEQYDNMILSSCAFACENKKNDMSIANHLLKGWERNAPRGSQNTVFTEDLLIEYYDVTASNIAPSKVFPVRIYQFCKTASGVRISIPIVAWNLLRYVVVKEKDIIAEDVKCLEELKDQWYLDIKNMFTENS